MGQAASLWGIEPGYWDIWGKYRQSRPEIRKAILRSLGVAAGDEASLQAAVRSKLNREWTRLTPPSLVVSEKDSTISLAVPAGLAAAVIEIQWEDGASTRYQALLELPDPPERVELEGRSYERRRASLPLRMPLGYHRLRVTAGESFSASHLIVTPEHAWIPPHLEQGGQAAGVAIALYGLRSERNWGCGDLADLERFIDWVAEELDADFVALNPLHAIHNRQPYNTSPYLPNSGFYRNPIYLDLERLDEFRLSPRAQALFLAPETQQELSELRRSSLVEYERIYALKLRFLRLCFDTFRRRCREGAPCRQTFEEFCRREGDLLERFATYCALEEWIHGNNPEIWIWPDWPAEYRDPDSPAVLAFARKHSKRVLFHKYVQWRLDEQLSAVQRRAIEKGLSIGLYHDLALATDRCGSDLWGHRSFFVTGCRVGSPPDVFSPQGQDWGFPPPSADRHREDGYRLFAESIRHNLRDGGALRIDHVMRFFRLFWIPDGEAAASGAYVRADHEDLVRILALESVRNKVLIIGEDLGTVEPGIRETLERFGILSYRLLYFERDGSGRYRAPGSYPRQAVASLTTHDLATLAGFWQGRDIEARHSAGLLGSQEAYRSQLNARAEDKQQMLDVFFEVGLLPDWFPRRAADVPELTGELHYAAVGFLARTPSMLIVVNQEDLTKETEQQNLPGSTWQYPNWRRKMKFSVEELRSSPQAHDFAAMFRDWLARTGRKD
jgi:4-alpha-glucanotransferase